MYAELQNVASMLTSMKTATELANAMIGVRDAAKLQTLQFDFQQALIEAQRHALTLQSEQFALVGRVREAEEEVARLKEWKAEEGKYKLREIPRSAFIYVSEPTGDPTEPEVWLCPNCWGNHRHGVLTFGGRSRERGSSAEWTCTSCSLSIETEGGMRPGHWRHRVEQLVVERDMQMKQEAIHLESLKKKRDEG